MRAMLKSDLFRFAGGFVLGAAALLSMQPQVVQADLAAWVGTVAHVV